MDYIITIQSVINTLNNIEVKGRSNIERLLACIQTLDDMQSTLKKEAEKNAP